MSDLIIPKTFTLAGVKHTVTLVPNLTDNSVAAFGKLLPNSTIQLSKTILGHEMGYDKITNTFYHELVHAMLDSLDFDDPILKNESFITGMGNMFMEFLSTCRGGVELDNHAAK